MNSKLDTSIVELEDGARTTVHVAAYPLQQCRLAVVRLDEHAPIEAWCEEHGVEDAVSGGYSVKPEFAPLGDIWIDGRQLGHRPFKGAWAGRRAAIMAEDGRVAIGARDRLGDVAGGDLLQAGPLLVSGGRDVIAGAEDPEGFSATREEFDQDLTANREPRLAVGITGDSLLAVAADGRSDTDAGMTLGELARFLVDLGAVDALNLDGGSAGAIVAGGRRLNTPRDGDGNEMELAAPTVTAIVVAPR